MQSVLAHPNNDDNDANSNNSPHMMSAVAAGMALSLLEFNNCKRFMYIQDGLISPSDMDNETATVHHYSVPQSVHIAVIVTII